MEHRDIEERDLARLYCIGKLSQEEGLQFEAHFVDCPACLERLELLRSFRNGLKQTTGEDAALAWWLRGSIGRLAALPTCMPSVVPRSLPSVSKVPRVTDSEYGTVLTWASTW